VEPGPGSSKATDARAAQMSFILLKVRSRAFNEAYNLFFSVLFYNAMLGIIILSYMLLSVDELPTLVICCIFVCDSCMIVVGHFMFALATESNILSIKVLQLSIDKCSHSKYDLKVWKAMAPLRVDVGNVCSFETKEFLLFIWGDVVVSSIIDLLIAT